MVRNEFSATEVRRLLQELFPLRRLVLSQFTFFNQTGVACPTGETFRRKRRCYRIMDVLPIAVVLALKEQGIPLKNISQVPQLIQRHSSEIFRHGRGCRLYGLGTTISLQLPTVPSENPALLALLGADQASSAEVPSSGNTLDSDASPAMFWGFDVGELAEQICTAASRVYVSTEREQRAA